MRFHKANRPNKLPLVKKLFQLLVDQLRAQDHVAIVVYAGAAGTVLEPTSGDDKRKILAALDKLSEPLSQICTIIAVMYTGN